METLGLTYNYPSGINHPNYKVERSSKGQTYYDNNKEKILLQQKQKVSCCYCKKKMCRNWLFKHIKNTCKSLENPYTIDNLEQKKIISSYM